MSDNPELRSPPRQEPCQQPPGAVRRAFRRLRACAARLGPRRIRATFDYGRNLLAESRRRRQSDDFIVIVDATPLWGSVTGVGWYLYSLLEALRETPGVKFRLFGPPGETPAVIPPAGDAIEAVHFPVPDNLSLSPGILQILLRGLVPLLIRAEPAHVCFAPNFFLPRRFQWSRAPMVSMVHDLASLQFEWTLQEETAENLRRELRESIREARKTLTPSEAVRAEILSAGLAEESRVVAIHHGPGHLAFTPSAPRDETLRDRLDLDGKFALSVGTLEPRKNLRTLLQAWSAGFRMGLDLPTLVLCGARGWKNNDLDTLFEDGIGAGWLRVTGYVSDDELRQLYEDADLALQASLYEGFGLPLVEAMSVGTPLVCSDIPVFREVAGDAASYVAATDSEAWLAEIRRLMANPGALDELTARGRARCARFSWTESASRTLAVFRDAANPG